MTQFRNTVLAVVAAASLAGALSSPANAGGFLGGIINRVVPGAGPILDGIHERLGNPLDKARDQVLEQLFEDE